MKLGNYDERLIEAIIQGLVHGNLKNFHGYIGAFTYTHELAHRFAIASYSGRVLDDLSKSNHTALNILATEAGLSRSQIGKLWEEFWITNNRIKRLVQKFELVEEIFATYLGMRFLPTYVRNNVKQMLEEVLREKGWEKVYAVFEAACDNEKKMTLLFLASAILNTSCLFIESTDIDSAILLYETIELFQSDGYVEELPKIEGFLMDINSSFQENLGKLERDYKKIFDQYDGLSLDNILSIH